LLFPLNFSGPLPLVSRLETEGSRREFPSGGEAGEGGGSMPLVSSDGKARLAFEGVRSIPPVSPEADLECDVEGLGARKPEGDLLI
jgi:hypothetical protein